MEILMVGDVVGTAGCAHLRRVLPGIKKQYRFCRIIYKLVNK